MGGLHFVILILFLLLAAAGLSLHRARNKLRAQAAELQKAQQQEAVATLASGVAHDFNNILASILGFGVLLEEDLTAHPGMQEMAAQITTAARRGQSIVAQLMSYSRKTIKDDSHIRMKVSVDALVRESTVLLKPCLRSSTRLDYINEAANDTLLLDPTQISQAIVNLCINADHAIGAKTGTIKIRLENISLLSAENSGGLCLRDGQENPASLKIINGALPAGKYLRLSIEDNGEGMTREIAERIFDPFFTTKDVGIGTGLGLAAIQGIVHDHGGAIAVTTERYKGSCFDIFLPMPQDTDE